MAYASGWQGFSNSPEAFRFDAHRQRYVDVPIEGETPETKPPP